MKKITNFLWFGKQLAFKSSDRGFSSIFVDRFQNYAQGSTTEILSGELQILFLRSHVIGQNSNSLVFGNSHSFDGKSGLILHRYLSTKTSIKYDFADDKLTSITITYSPGTVFTLLNFLLRGLLERQLFSVLIQEYVEKAVLSILSKKDTIEVLHAASIEKDGRVVAFTGLNGVGKSTLAQYFVHQLGWSMYSDNYLLLKDNRAYYNPENSRLSQKSLSLFSSTSTKSNQASFGKTTVFLSEDKKSKKLQAVVSDIYIVFRSPTYFHTKISRAKAQRIISTLLVTDSEAIRQHPISLFLDIYSDSIIVLPENITYHVVQFSHPKELVGIIS